MHRPGIIGGRPHSGGGGYVGPLDIVPGATVAYSQMRLAAAFSGPVINIHNGTSAEDFAASTNNAVDPAAISAFIGGGAGKVQWYDQGGNVNDATNADASSRPLWSANEINGLPGVVFDPTGIGQFLGTVPITLVGGAFNAFFVIKKPANSSTSICGMNFADVSGPDGPDLRVGFSVDILNTNSIVGESSGFSTSYNYQSATGNAAPDTFYIYEVYGTAAAGGLYLNGVLQPFTIPPTSEAVGDISWPLGIGTADVADAAAGGANYMFGGTLVEMFAYNSTSPGLSPNADRLALRQNIAGRYKFTL